MRTIGALGRAGSPRELLSAGRKVPPELWWAGPGLGQGFSEQAAGFLGGWLLLALGLASLLPPPLPSLLLATPFPACHTAVLPTLLPDYLSSGFLEQMFWLLPASKTNRRCVVICSPGENPSAAVDSS